MKEYFSHDFNARNDKKTINLIMKRGLEGLGAFWCIIEMLYEESGYLKLDEYERIAFELRTKKDIIKSVINDFDLFKNDGEKFWSESVLARLKLRMEKSDKARKSVENRWGKYERNTNVLPTINERYTNKVNKSKVNKSKVNKSKVNKSKFIAPSLSDVENYFSECGYNSALAKKAFDYYSVANWHDSKGNPVKNWKQKMQANWFKDEGKTKSAEPVSTKKEFTVKWMDNGGLTRTYLCDTFEQAQVIYSNNFGVPPHEVIPGIK